MQNKSLKVEQKIFIALFIGSLLVMLFGYVRGYELSIPWSVTTTAESAEISVHQFTKGLFEFEFTGKRYSLAESFSADPIKRNHTQDLFFLCLIFTGICIILAVSTFLSRLWFLGVSGLFIFLIINTRLQDIGIFGLQGSVLGPVIILIAYLGTAYAYHAFFTNLSIWIRIGSLMLITVLIAAFSGVDLMVLHDQIVTGSFFGLVALTLLFLFLIAEEIVFLILFLITRSKGSKSNQVHFSLFAVVYLGFLIAYYLNKSGIVRIELTYFDPYILFTISAIVAAWTLKFKEDVISAIMSIRLARILYLAIGLTVFGFLGASFFRGNDPVYEGFHYFIIYAHLGFGCMFFFYLILNFINPLIKGFQVYKIAYKEQNFPYVTAKIGGIVAVAGFFFLSGKEPFLLFRSAHFNYMGAQSELVGERNLAMEYYLEGSIYGYDNHFSNYKLAFNALSKDAAEEANYRFKRASLRYPSPQSFVNQSNTYAMMGEGTPSLISLKSGLQDFPGNEQILNNIGLIYTDLGQKDQALSSFKKAGESSEWTSANLTNLWKINSTSDTAMARADFNEGLLPVKTNIIGQYIDTPFKPDIRFDTIYLFPSFPLHRLSYLTNAAWFFKGDTLVGNTLENSLTGAIEESVFENAKLALALNRYLGGQVNKSLFLLDQLQRESLPMDRGKYFNMLGLIALEQRAPEMANKYFEEAISFGSINSSFHKVSALMEMGKFSDALKWTEVLVAEDSTYQKLYNDLILVTGAKENIPENLEFPHLYYSYSEYSSGEKEKIFQKSTTTQLNSLWEKISYQLLLNNSFQALDKESNLFRPYLNAKVFYESELVIALQKDSQSIPNPRINQLMQASDTTEIISGLKLLANMNALNVPVILALSQEINLMDENIAYDALLDAYKINDYSPELIKAYVDQCIQMHLSDYAETALNRLSELIPEEEYYSYLNEVNKRLESIEDESWSF